MNDYAVDCIDYMTRRKRRFLTQWELSLLTRIPPYRISAFECGRLQLTSNEIKRINKALDLTERNSA